MTIITDTIKPLASGSVSLRGRLGASLRLSIANRLKKVDYTHLVEPFRLRNETDGRWRCEFWGKIVRSAILSWRGQPDTELLQLIKNTVADIISTQTEDGCISSYPLELQTKDWDIWGRKYILIGLARYYLEIEPDEKVKTAMIRELDYLMVQVGPNAKNIINCGWHDGLAATSILEPVVLTYRITGEKRFLDYALWIVAQGGSTVNNIFKAILEGVPPAQLGNGKSYEMMSCFEGLAELYRETGTAEYLESITTFYKAVRDQEIFITGVGGLKDTWGEFWDNGKIKQSQFNVGGLGETCVTTTWIKFCGQVLRLTGDSTVVDEMERTLYNGVLGAMVPDGSWWSHVNPTPLAGPAIKTLAKEQMAGFYEDCCVAQGPKALAIAPWLAVMNEQGPVINLYEASEATVNNVKIVINGDFPLSGNVTITVTPKQTVKFPVKLRIPAWSKETKVSVNGEDYAAMPGTYLTIDRIWKSGDSININFDMSVRVIPPFDGGDRVALMRGPIVLAQDSRLGKVDSPLLLNTNNTVTVSEVTPPKNIFQAHRLADGTSVCDYASAGNEFSRDNHLCVWMNNNPITPVKVNSSPSAKHATSAREFQGIPGIEVTQSGRIWATWYSGGIAEGPDNFILLVTSSDNGKTWSEPVAVVDPPGNVRAFDPVLWIDPSKRLWWFWSQSYSPEDGKVFDGKAGVWASFAENPELSNPSFSNPVRIANGIMMNKPTILSNGEWVLPTAVWECLEPKIEAMKKERFSNITVSSDNGKSFQLKSSANVLYRSFDEHMIVELNDKRLWMLVRTQYGIGQSFSSDMGKTWTHGENSNLGGPNSRFFIRRLSSGNLLFVNNANISAEKAVEQFISGATAERKRANLTAFISDDDGKTWKGRLLLDERTGVSYPDGIEDEHGIIRIIYDRERHKEGEILMATFREEDVLSGKQVSKEFRLKQLVNRTGGVKKMEQE